MYIINDTMGMQHAHKAIPGTWVKPKAEAHEDKMESDVILEDEDIFGRSLHSLASQCHPSTTWMAIPRK
jgi:hypothetical protein